MTNNFEFIKKYMQEQNIPATEEDARDLFFNIMLIRRGKDFPDMPAANYTFKSYYIDSIEKLNKVQDEIITCCDMFGLRAYVSVNVKSKEDFTKICTVKFAENNLSGDYKKPWRIIDHVFGSLQAKNKGRWIIDIDKCDDFDNYLNEICHIINMCDSKYEQRIIAQIPTKSGIHLITYPFNVKQFADLCESKMLDKPEIKRNHITLLYEDLNAYNINKEYNKILEENYKHKFGEN